MLGKLSLKATIFAGFGVVLCFLVMLAVMSWTGVRDIGHDFVEYRQTARESLLVNEAMQSMLEVTRAAQAFRLTNRPDDARHVDEGVDALKRAVDDLGEFATRDAIVQASASVGTHLSDYRHTFDEIVVLQTRRNDLVPQLDDVGAQARRTLSAIMASAYRDHDVEAAYHAGVVQENLMLGRYYAEKYLLQNAPEDLDRALMELAEAEEATAILDRSLQNPQRRALLADYRALLARYNALFADVSAVIQTRNGLVADELDPTSRTLIAGFGSMRDSAVDLQNTIGPRAAASVASVSRNSPLVALVSLLLGVAAAVLIGRFITRLIAQSVDRMTQLANGDLDVEVIGTEREDELGDMARALLVFRDKGLENQRLQAEQAEAEQRAEAEKRKALNAMADEFEANVNEVVGSVSNAAQLMVGLSSTLSQAAGRAGERSTTVAAASEEASTNVETVAAASEQMTNSIAEVSERITQSASMTEDAARGTEKATSNVSKLSASAQTIGDVIAMISAIAEQTNLLALNATIEAARAGEAGKGFAVVASEVKSLASQTARATEEISEQITGMQTDTSAVVEAIESIGSMIQELNAGASSIAAAVEQQHSATQEIARNTQQAADGTREVSANISQVSTAVQETGSAAGEVLSASSQLADEAQRLRDSVSSFLQSIRAA